MAPPPPGASESLRHSQRRFRRVSALYIAEHGRYRGQVSRTAERASSSEEKPLRIARLYVPEDFVISIDARDASHRERAFALLEDHKLDVALSEELKSDLLAPVMFPKCSQIAIVIEEKRRPNARTNLAHETLKVGERGVRERDAVDLCLDPQKLEPLRDLDCHASFIEARCRPLAGYFKRQNFELRCRRRGVNLREGDRPRPHHSATPTTP